MDAKIAIADENERARVARIKVVAGGEPADWRAIYERLDSSTGGLTVVLFNLAVTFSTFAGLFAAIGLLAAGIWRFFPGTSPYHVAVFVIPPGFLVGAAAGQAGGNLFFRMWYGLDDATRRGFATRLTLGRAPSSWPGSLRRWLFSGDWMGTPEYDPRLPYLRIFVVGAAPATCREEDAVWREIHGAIAGDAGREAGANHREISYPGQLPEWARSVGNGDGVESLRKRIGDQAANEWVAHLWRRARRQWPALGPGSRPGGTRRDGFELHWLRLPGDREALAVILRPAAGDDAPERTRRDGRNLAA